MHESIHEVVSHLAAVYFLLGKVALSAEFPMNSKFFCMSFFLRGLGVHRKSRGSSFQAYLI